MPTEKHQVRHEVSATCLDCPTTWAPSPKQIAGAASTHARVHGHTVSLTYSGEVRFVGATPPPRPRDTSRMTLEQLRAMGANVAYGRAAALADLRRKGLL